MTIKSKQLVPPLDAQRLEAMAKILADTNDGLSGSEIGYLLQDSRIPDVSPNMTKWKRLFNAFIEFQNQHQAGNHVVVFISRAMKPVSYTDRRQVFEDRRDRLNAVLALCGMELRADGRVRFVTQASDLDEALTRANRLKAALTQRNVHPDVLEHCRAELVEQNYFHAVFEAMKSITTKIRELSGVDGDGKKLVQDVFAFLKGGHPRFVINDFDRETLHGEQLGFISLLKGLYGTVRNPLAHEPKMEWDISEQDALDILTTISFVHRKLDQARRWSSRSPK